MGGSFRVDYFVLGCLNSASGLVVGDWRGRTCGALPVDVVPPAMVGFAF